MAHLIYSALPHPTRPITYVAPDTSVSQCIEILTTQDIGALVVKHQNTLIGIVSERDIIRQCLFNKLEPEKTTALDIAYTEVTVLSVNDSIDHAMEAITQTKRRHLLIVENDELVAILSIGDLLFHILEDKMHTIEQLENYIHTY